MILALQNNISSGSASQFRCCSFSFYSFTVDPVWQNKQIGLHLVLKLQVCQLFSNTLAFPLTHVLIL